MPKDNQINVRVNDPTNEAIEAFAEKRDFNKAEAVRVIVKDRLAGEGHLDHSRVMSDGGSLMDATEAISERQKDTTKRIEDLSHQLKEQQQRQLVIAGGSVVVAVGMLFILAELTTGLPAWVTLTAGPLLIIGLLVYLWGVFHV